MNNWDQKQKDLDDVFKRKLPTDESKIRMLQTNLGASMVVVDYLAKIKDPSNVPVDVMYSIVLIINNVNGMIYDKECNLSFFDVSEEHDIMKFNDEQKEEWMIRMTKKIVYQLYEGFNKHEI